MLNFKDMEYANTRFSGTWVKKDKKLVYIHRINLEGRVTYMTNDEGSHLHCDFGKLDLSPVKLGYRNMGTQSFYLYRLPIRQYKQGLRPENIGGSNVRIQMYSLKDVNYIKYPNIEQCLDRLENREAVRVAWSPKFSIMRSKNEMNLLYKQHTVGNVNTENGKCLLHSKNLYLQESLEEALR